jgi:hypothetical protein
VIQAYTASALSMPPSWQVRFPMQFFRRTPQDTITLGLPSARSWALWPAEATTLSAMLPAKAGQEAMRQLIESWLADDADEQRRTLDYLRQSLKESGLSSRQRL